MAEGVGGTALARGMGCLGRSTLVGGVSGTVAGGFGGAAGYLTGPGPHTVGGFLGATGGGAVFGGFTGAGAGALSSVTNTSRFGCFPAGTRVLMADGTARPIEDVEVGDRVASADPDTGRPVTATFTHRDVDTIRVSTDRGELVATAAHPLYAQGRGFTPAGDLRPGDVLRDVDGPAARVIRVRPAGRARTVHNIVVDTTHAYYVATTTGTWTLAHNGCTWDESAARWRDTETGQFTTAPSDPSGLVSNGRINYNDIVKLGEVNGVTIKETWGQGGRVKIYASRPVSSHTHGAQPDPNLPTGNSTTGPTTMIRDKSTRSNYATFGRWVKFARYPNESHIPTDNWPFENNPRSQ